MKHQLILDRRIFGIALIIAFMAVGASNASPATYSAGQTCYKSGQQLKTKPILICIGYSNKLSWTQLPSVPKTTNAYVSLLGIWNQKLLSIDFSQVDRVLAMKDSLIRLENSADLLSLQTRLKTVQSGYQNLVTQSTNNLALISNENSAVVNAKASVANLLANYQSAVSQTNSLYSSYNTAMTNRAYALACTIGVMFGTMAGPCYPENSYNSFVISQYNSLKARSDAAWQAYQSAQTSFNSIMQNYYADATKNEIMDSEADILAQDSQSLQSAANTLQAFQTIVRADGIKMNTLDALDLDIKNFISTKSDLIRAAIASKNSTSTYVSAFVAYSAAISASNILLSSGGVMPDLPVAPSYEVISNWLPSTFFRGSSYSAITISGPDFGWNWSKFYACTGSCNVALVVAKSNCANAQVTVNWQDSSSNVVGSSTGSIPMMTHGVVYPVPFALPKTLDATKSYTAYLSSFHCDL